ncbi:MAG: recombinase family protein [Oscillospiraceae bacterium]|nr:recombinase family protein [Oscillospiraceae bacterium]
MLCAVYCRLSKEDAQKQGVESESIANQRAMLQGYAMAQGWQIYQEYIDSDYSGSDRTRPAFNEMLRDAKNHCFEIILCKSQSRFTRELELVEKYIHHDFLLWNIRFVAPADQIDTAALGGKKARQINGLVNEWYLEDTSANIRAILDDKRKRGVFIGNTAPYGYLKQNNSNHTLTIDKPAAKIVKQMFTAFLNGATYTDIAALLNQMEVETPAMHSAGLAGKPVKKGLWSVAAISRILSNEVYIGNLVQGKRRKASYKDKKILYVPSQSWIVVKNTHPSIVTQREFEQVQHLRGNATRKRADKAANVLSGFVYCGLCGHSVTRKASGAKKVYYYLCCPACKNMRIPQEKLEELVLQQMQNHYFDAIPGKAPKGNALENSVLKLKAQFALLYNDRLNGRITTTQFEQANCHLLHCQNALEALAQQQASAQTNREVLKAFEKKVGEIELPPLQTKQPHNAQTQKKQPLCLTHRLLSNAVKKITLYPSVPQTLQKNESAQTVICSKKRTLCFVIEWCNILR